MGQLNLNLTPEFQRDLDTIMRKRRIKRKSDAIRLAVHELARAEQKRRDFAALLGALTSYPEKDRRRFEDRDALWLAQVSRPAKSADSLRRGASRRLER